MDQELIILRGIPASGKSTFAVGWTSTGNGRVRINRDDIRYMTYGTYYGDNINERLITKLEDAMITAALNSGKSVVVDDTNIKHAYVKRIAELGHIAGVKVSVKQFDIDVEEAIARNLGRQRQVPEDVIRDMHRRLKASGPVDISRPKVSKYEPKPGSTKAVVIDIDGTLAQMTDRGPFEWDKVDSDEVVEQVKMLAQWAYAESYFVIILSGRDGSCEELTSRWLLDNYIPYDDLWMRTPGDNRKDTIIKSELFDQHIAPEFDVQFVVDDRPSVCRMWRDKGLFTFQVGDPHKEF